MIGVRHETSAHRHRTSTVLSASSPGRTPMGVVAWPTEQRGRVLLDAAAAIERVPELLGVTSHLIATARRVR